MSNNPQVPATASRPVLAAVASLAVLWLSGAPLTGPLSSFAQSLPLVALCAVWLAGRAQTAAKPAAALAAATLLVAPAVGFHMTRVGIDVFDVVYIQPELALRQALNTAAITPGGTGPLLLAAAVAAALGLGRQAAPAVGALLGGAGATLIARRLLAAAGLAWQHHDFGRAARLGWASGWICGLALLGGALGLAWAHQAERESPHAAPPPYTAGSPHTARHSRALLTVLISLVAAWSAAPPLTQLVRALPLPLPLDALQVVSMPRGRVFAAPVLQLGDTLPLDPDPIAQQLRSWNFRRLRSEAWPCEPLPPHDWANTPRNAVIVPLPPTAATRRLVPIIRQLIDHGVYDLVLPGSAPELPGSYGQHLRSSGSSLLLDRPPLGSLWLAADAWGWQVVQAAPWFAEGHATCVLIADPAMSIGRLTRLTYLLSEPGAGGPCQDGLALAPLEPQSSWETDPQPLGCAALQPPPSTTRAMLPQPAPPMVNDAPDL